MCSDIYAGNSYCGNQHRNEYTPGSTEVGKRCDAECDGHTSMTGYVTQP